MAPRRTRGQYTEAEDVAIVQAVEECEKNASGAILWKVSAYPLFLKLVGKNTTITMDHMKNRFKTIKTGSTSAAGVKRRRVEAEEEEEGEEEDAQAAEEAAELGYRSDEPSISEEDEESQESEHVDSDSDDAGEEEEIEYGGDFDNYSEYSTAQSLGSGESVVQEFWVPGENVSVRSPAESGCDLDQSSEDEDLEEWVPVEADPYEQEERHHRLVFTSDEEFDMKNDDDSVAESGTGTLC